MSNNKELSQDYFDRHPNSDACHITSDGRVFHNAGTASSYAVALEDKTVETFNRDEKKVEEIEVNEVQLEETLADFDAETTSYEQGKALFAELGLTAESKSKVAIFAALTAAKEAAQTQE